MAVVEVRSVVVRAVVVEAESSIHAIEGVEASGAGAAELAVDGEGNGPKGLSGESAAIS